MSNHSTITRRRFLAMLSASSGAALLAACGAQSVVPAPTSAPATAAPATTSASAGTAAYPRTIQDKYGAVAIPARPQRIMNFYGNAGLDAVLALGGQPVLIATYDGFTLLPWQSAANDVPFLIMPEGTPNQERVIAEGIDLIITAEYPTATQAARDERLPFAGRIPIISVDQADFEGQLRIVGAALGLEDQAATKAAEVAQLFADFTPPRMPQSVKAFGTYGDGTFYMFRAASGLSSMIERFGLPPLTAPTTIGDQAIDPEAVHSISLEQMEELEADLLIGTGYNGSPLDSVVDSPLFGQLAAVREGRFVAFTNDDSFALAYGSVLSIPVARDALTKVLTAYAAAS
jgi:ABC-type Fe3+-hydroxamate transport system substrate-binding protein